VGTLRHAHVGVSPHAAGMSRQVGGGGVQGAPSVGAPPQQSWTQTWFGPHVLLPQANDDASPPVSPPDSPPPSPHEGQTHLPSTHAGDPQKHEKSPVHPPPPASPDDVESELHATSSA
jgi:hypothetical protein